MIRALLSFLDDRTGWPSALGRWIDEAPRLSPLAVAIGALLLLQAGTGFALSLHYAPTTTDAWGSVHFLQHELPLGAWIRSLHRWGTSALVVLVGLHLLLTAVSGRYRRPGEVRFWLGLLLLGVVLAFGITGNPLPWDQGGYWGVRIEAEIFGSIPWIGPWMKGLFLGGNEAGNLTLTRMYAIHVVALPCAVGGIVLASWSQAKRHPRLQTRRWAGWAAAGAVAAVGILGWVWPVELDAPAEVTVAYEARPAWYFLPLNRWMSVAPNPTLGLLLPLVAMGLVGALPLLDRREAWSQRLPWLGGIGIGAVGLISLLVSGWDLPAPAADEDGRRALALAANGIPPDGAGAMLARDPLTLGKRIFATECAPCHRVGGEGTDRPNGPDLAGYLSEAWLQALIEDPSDPRFFGTTDIDEMEPYRDEDPVLVGRVAAFVASLRGHPGKGADDLPPEGLEAFEALDCGSCHELEPGEEGAAPNLSGYGSDEWLRGFLRHPDDPLFYGSSNEMPSYEPEELSDEELGAVITWLRHLGSLPVAEAKVQDGR